MDYGYLKEFDYRQARAAKQAERQRYFAEARQQKKFRGERRRRSKRWRRRQWLREQLT